MQMPSNSMMGYDRAITIFSPDGRLLQVEYAKKTVSQGTTAMGLVCKDGIVLVADKRVIYQLMKPEGVEKIFKVDKHIGATMSGLVGDGRVLIERCQTIAQNHQVTFGEPVDILTVVREICNYKHLFTVYAGARPFGVSLLIAGVDSGKPRLFMTEPAGIYNEYNACALGEGAAIATKLFEKEYKKDMTIAEGIELGFKALKRIPGVSFHWERVDVALVDTKKGEFKKLEKDEIQKILKKVK